MPSPAMRASRVARVLLVIWAFSLTACGVASISPIVPADEQEFDAALVGRWRDAESTEFALIRGDSVAGYEVSFVDEDGRTGRFEARLGRLAGFRVLDVQPTKLDLSRDGDLYESLVLRLHSLVVIDRLTSTELVYRVIDADSLNALLDREPLAIAHALSDGEGARIITAPAAETRRFFERLLRQRGFLSDSVRYIRQVRR